MTDLEAIAIVLLVASPFVVWRMTALQRENARLARCYEGVLTAFKNVTQQNKDLRRGNSDLRSMVQALASEFHAMRCPKPVEVEGWIEQTELDANG